MILKLGHDTESISMNPFERAKRLKELVRLDHPKCPNCLCYHSTYEMPFFSDPKTEETYKWDYVDLALELAQDQALNAQKIAGACKDEHHKRVRSMYYTTSLCLVTIILWRPVSLVVLLAGLLLIKLIRLKRCRARLELNQTSASNLQAHVQWLRDQWMPIEARLVKMQPVHCPVCNYRWLSTGDDASVSDPVSGDKLEAAHEYRMLREDRRREEAEEREEERKRMLEW